jgi:hypothetical protein
VSASAPSDADVTATAARYRRFAEVEARGLSPRYEEWALGVAADPDLCARIAALPTAKQQVNLVFGAARLHGAPLGPWTQARDWMRERWDELVPTILARATQTNEAGRCATLLPVLADIPGPLALLEVGASAGLCLVPDRYGYRYETAAGTVGIGTDAAVVLPCSLSGAEPPQRRPDVVWRAGIDLNPLDAGDPDDRAWLEALVWPEHEDRRARLTAASAVVADDPPRIVRGDLVAQLPALAAQAPPDATLVVFHTAVLVYLSTDDRARFRDEVARAGAVWVSNEAPGVFGDIDARLPAGVDTRGTFVLSRDGSPVALTHPHGRWYRGL